MRLPLPGLQFLFPAPQGQLQLLEHERTQIAERTTTVGTWLSNYDERVKNNQVSQPTPLAFQSSA